MDPVTVLEGIQATNALLITAMNLITAAQKAMTVIAEAHAAGKPIAKADWDAATADADAARKRLADAIAQAEQQQSVGP